MWSHLARRFLLVGCLAAGGIPQRSSAQSADAPVRVIRDSTGLRLTVGGRPLMINGVNWDELAAPFGALGLRVRTAAELRPALEAARAAMAEGRSVILNAEIAIEAPRARPDVST